MIYFNITLLDSWNRPPVGIVRTIFEMARWLLKHQPQEVRFFVCRYKNFYEISIDGASETVKYLEELSHESYAIIHRKKYPYLRHVCWKICETLWIKRTQRLAVKRLIRQKFYLPKLFSLLTDKKLKLRPTDTLITLGADWDHSFTVPLQKLVDKTKCKVAMFFHDAIPIIQPHFCSLPFAEVFKIFPETISNVATHVFCNSRATQRDLKLLLQEQSLKIPSTSVVTLGSNSHASTLNKKPDFVLACDERFLLFVSTIEPRKNHRVLYQSYNHLLNQGVNELPKIIFVGMEGWGVNELVEEIQRNPLSRDYFTIANHVSDAELAWLYKNCLFTVFPSFYEGWGIPVAESLAHGKFCLSSNRGSLPEVGGDFVEYLDPWDTVAWGEKILQYANNPELLQTREDKIKREYTPPTWDQFCEDIYKTLKTLEDKNHLH